MRFSVQCDDPGYRALKRLPKGVKPIIRLDGVELRQVITVDDRRGYALAVDTDADGRIRTNLRRDRVLLKQLRGNVTIELRRVR